MKYKWIEIESDKRKVNSFYTKFIYGWSIIDWEKESEYQLFLINVKGLKGLLLLQKLKIWLKYSD